VIPVHFSSLADDPRYFNKRSELYFRAADVGEAQRLATDPARDGAASRRLRRARAGTSAIGVYGVTSYSVARRTNENGRH
jgi:hypothetical protein